MATEVKERRSISERIETQLKKVGVKAKGYKRGPSGADVFIASLNRGVVLIWPGAAEVEVKGSKRHKQAVLNVTEKQRTVTHEVTTGYIRKGHSSLEPFDATNESLRRELIRAFPVRFPDNDAVKWTFSNLTKGPVDAVGYGDYITVTAKVKAVVPASKQAFLVGQDETNQFISMLPKQAKSVVEAHRILRPKGVTDKALRQGEWFFEPVSEKLSKQLDAHLAADPRRLNEPDQLQAEGGDYSTHWATTMHYKGKEFAIGWVTDRRATSRWSSPPQSHHAPLFLADWHEVFHNTELEPPPSVSGRSQSWD